MLLGHHEATSHLVLHSQLNCHCRSDWEINKNFNWRWDCDGKEQLKSPDQKWPCLPVPVCPEMYLILIDDMDAGSQDCKGASLITGWAGAWELRGAEVSRCRSKGPGQRKIPPLINFVSQALGSIL